MLTALLAGSLQRALLQSRAQADALSRLSTELEDRVTAQTAELAQRAERAEALYEVSRALSSTIDLHTVLGLITDSRRRRPSRRASRLKDATIQELMHGVRSVMPDRLALEPSVAERLLDRVADPDSGGELSERELEVLGLLVDGSSNRAIAQRLHVSENTVKAHISHIFTKPAGATRSVRFAGLIAAIRPSRTATSPGPCKPEAGSRTVPPATRRSKPSLRHPPALRRDGTVPK